MRSRHDHCWGPPHFFFRAMRAKRWMMEHPTDEEIIKMLEEYQRDLEQEVANVAERIARLRDAADA